MFTAFIEPVTKMKPEKYRADDILPSLSKTLWKVIKIQSQDYTDFYELLDMNYFGNLKGNNTEHDIRSVIRYIHDSFNNESFSIKFL